MMPRTSTPSFKAEYRSLRSPVKRVICSAWRREVHNSGFDVLRNQFVFLLLDSPDARNKQEVPQNRDPDAKVVKMILLIHLCLFQ